MKKQMLILRGSPTDSYSQFSDQAHKLAEHLDSLSETKGLKLTLTLQPPPQFSVIPFSKSKVAVISVFSEEGLLLKPNSTTSVAGFYEVTEAIPISYKKTWPDRIQTPGIGLLTLFNKKKNIDYPNFYNRWHNGHTPLSFKIHPFWNYNRNVVNQKNEGTETWDGIVEEQVKEPRQLLNPIVFFGGIIKMVYNMIRVYLDTVSFIDYPSMETYLTHEVWFNSNYESASLFKEISS